MRAGTIGRGMLALCDDPLKRTDIPIQPRKRLNVDTAADSSESEGELINKKNSEHFPTSAP